MTSPDDDTGFDADSIEPLTYNFSKWLSNDGIEQHAGKRTIPEPSTEAVSKFAAEYDRLLAQARDIDLEEEKKHESTEDRDARIERNIVKGMAFAQQFEERRCALVAELCRDTPSAEELLKLPHRVRRSFFGYILRGINPEA